MGCCLIVGVLAASPRIILLGMWLFTDYLSRIGLPFIWGFIGWIFVPCTTIAYAIAENSFGGLQGWGTVVFAAGIVLDILLYSSGAGRGSAESSGPRPRDVSPWAGLRPAAAEGRRSRPAPPPAAAATRPSRRAPRRTRTRPAPP